MQIESSTKSNLKSMKSNSSQSREQLLNETQELVSSLQQKLNAVVICISKAWGGLEQVAAADSLHLVEKQLKVKFVCLNDSPVHRHLLDFNQRQSQSQKQTIEIELLYSAPRNAFDFLLKKKIDRWVTQEGVNLIHVHQTSLLGSLSPWLWRYRHVALVASRHIMNNHNKKDFFHSLIYRRLDSLLVMSETLRQNVLLTHNLKERQVKIVRLGIDFNLFQPDQCDPNSIRGEWGADADTVVIGLVGRIDPAKGQATFVRAAAGLCQMLPSKTKVKFVMVGEETVGSRHTVDELKKLIKIYQIEPHVVFAGFIKEIPKVMAAFDILVMPSRREAFGMVAIEGMAMECPVIVSNAGSAREIVGNEDYGLLVRPDDAFDLQKKIRWLLDHPEQREQMGKKARAYVREHFDIQIRIKRTLAVYDRMLRLRKVKPKSIGGLF